MKEDVVYNEKKIYSDLNAVEAAAVMKDGHGRDVEGHHYIIYAPFGNDMYFQNGPVKEEGVNGITNESLLAILVHRTKFLDSKFPCEENKAAIRHMEAALSALEARTTNRVLRGVEGSNES